MAETGNNITVGNYLDTIDRRLIVKALVQLDSPKLRGVSDEECIEKLGNLMDWFTNATNVHIRSHTEKRNPA